MTEHRQTKPWPDVSAANREADIKITTVVDAARREQRRYEIAKEIMVGLVVGLNTSCGDLPIATAARLSEEAPAMSVRGADRLLAALEGTADDD